MSAAAGEPAARPPLPPFTEEHERFRADVREFFTAELRPHAREWERAHWFPNDVFAWMAERGYLGLKYEEQYGGGPASGEGYRCGGYLADAVLNEEIAHCGSGGLASGIGAHIGIATPPVWKFGTDDQKQRYLAPAIRGEKIAALAITEPDAGSDVAGIKTAARRVDGGWVVNGSKMFITNGVRADFMVTAVKTSPEGGHHGLSFLIIDRGPGVESSAMEKLGWHASDTGLISFDDVYVPEENLLGQENKGFYLIMANFQWERLLMALGAVGSMTTAVQGALALAATEGLADRDSAGQPSAAGISEADWVASLVAAGGAGGTVTDGTRGNAQSRSHQALRHRLANLATTLEAGRAVTYNALRLFASGEDAVREVTIAKLATQRAAYDTLDECLQIAYDVGWAWRAGADDDRGANGLGATLADLERGVRDTRLGPIGGGTDEIMKEILGKTLGL